MNLFDSPLQETALSDAQTASPTVIAANLMNLTRRSTDFEVINFALQQIHHLNLRNRQIERLGIIPFLVECVQRRAVSQETADLIFARFRQKEAPQAASSHEKVVLKIKLSRQQSSTILRSPDGDKEYCSESSDCEN